MSKKQEYPKYLYHGELPTVVVSSADEEAELEAGYAETPQESTYQPVPYGAEDEDLTDKTRVDLVEFARLKFGLELKGDMPREKLLAAIKKAAKAKAADPEQVETQPDLTQKAAG